MNTKTVVTDAEGYVREFGDWLSKFVVAHPKTASIIALVIGGALGWIAHAL